MIDNQTDMAAVYYDAAAEYGKIVKGLPFLLGGAVVVTALSTVGIVLAYQNCVPDTKENVLNDFDKTYYNKSKLSFNDLVNNCKLIEVMNNETNKTEIFLSSISNQEYNMSNSKVNKITYYSIIDGSSIFTYLTGDNIKSTNCVIKEEEISAYLLGLDQIKNEYTKKDLEVLLDQIREIYDYNQDKTLVK